MIKAVIFDMDGLMIETEHLQSQSFEKVLKEYGKKPILNKDGVVQLVGITAKKNWVLLKKRYHIDEAIEVLLAKKRKIYIKLLEKNIAAKPGLYKLVKFLVGHKIKIAVASNSVRQHIEFVLSKLKLIKHFTLLVSGEDLRRGKPFPDIFLKTAKHLKVKPGECLVLEDAEVGIIAAKRAGMKVIAIPNRYTKSQDFSLADRIVQSLARVNSKLISSL